jgi:plastocyanin
LNFIRLSLAALVVSALVAASALGASTAVRTLYGKTGPGFTISLKNKAGKRVKTLKAGTYTIKVSDKSSIHNFHLKGPGVNKKTTVSFIGMKTWKVKLTKGTYKYKCDIHFTIMHGKFTVVS